MTVCPSHFWRIIWVSACHYPTPATYFILFNNSVYCLLQYWVYALLGSWTWRQLSLYLDLKLGDNNMFPAPTHLPPNEKGGYTFFLHNYILHIMWKSFFFTFPIYFLQDLELPPRSKFRSVVGGWGQGTYCCPPTSNPDRGSTASMFSCLAMPRGVDWLNSHDSMPLPLLENNMSECLPLPHPSHLFYFIQ
jgi:hypothetical protein